MSACARSIGYSLRMKRAQPASRVEQQPGGARVAVARLSDGARVEQLLAPERHLLPRLGLAALERVVVAQSERELHVAVADEREIGGLSAQRGVGDVGRQDVLPDGVADRAVEERDAFARALGREVREQLELGGRQHAARPACGHAGIGGELRDVEHAGDDEVVVAAQADGGALAHERQALARLAAVADDVAEAPELVDALLAGVLEHGLERRQVAVDVRYDCDAQEWSATRRRGRLRRRTPAAA